MDRRKKLAWDLYKSGEQLDSREMKEIVDKLPCSQFVKNRFNNNISIQENIILEKISNEFIPKIFIEELTTNLDVNNDIQKGGGEILNKFQNKIIKNFLKKQLNIDTQDSVIDKLLEQQFTFNESFDTEIVDMQDLIQKAEYEVNYIQSGGAKEIDEEEEEKKFSNWTCPDCGYTKNIYKNNLCVKCSALNPTPSKDDYQKWKEYYPNMIKIITISMKGFKVIFKRILDQLYTETEKTKEVEAQFNQLLFDISPENIIRQIYEKKVQAVKLFTSVKEYITKFMDDVIMTLKDIIFWTFNKFKQIWNYTSEKISNFLYPKTYLSNESRIDAIMEKLNPLENYELYTLHTQIDDIMEFDRDDLEEWIQEWRQRGPATPIRNMTFKLIESIGYGVKGTLNAIGDAVTNKRETADEKSKFDIEAELKNKNRNDQRNKLVKYLNNIYTYLKTKRFLSDSGFNLGTDLNDEAKYNFTIYVFNMLLIFKKRWKYGLRPTDITIFDQMNNIKFSNNYKINQDKGGVFIKGAEINLKKIAVLIPHIKPVNDYYVISYNVKHIDVNIRARIKTLWTPMQKRYSSKYACRNSEFSINPVYGNCNTYTYEIEYLEPINKYIDQYIDYLDSADASDNLIEKLEFRPQPWSEQEYREYTGMQSWLHDKIIPSIDDDFDYKRYKSMVRLFSNNSSPDVKTIERYMDNMPYESTRTRETQVNYKDLKLRAQVIFEGTNNFTTISSSEYEEQFNKCSKDKYRGKLEYPEDGECKWEENSPPISSSSQWIKWIKSENASKFVREKIGQNLFRNDNPDTIPNKCENLKTKFNYKNVQIGDEIYVIQATPNYFGPIKGGEFDFYDGDKPREPAKVASTAKKIFFYLNNDSTDYYLKAKIIAIKFNDGETNKLLTNSSEELKKMKNLADDEIKKKYSFIVQYLDISTIQEYIERGKMEALKRPNRRGGRKILKYESLLGVDGINNLLKDYDIYLQTDVQIDNIAVEDLNNEGDSPYDEQSNYYKMKKLIYSYLCEKSNRTGNINKDVADLNINILKMSLILDYAAIEKYDNYEPEQTGGGTENNLFYTVDSRGFLCAVVQNENKIISIDSTKFINHLDINMFGGADPQATTKASDKPKESKKSEEDKVEQLSYGKRAKDVFMNKLEKSYDGAKAWFESDNFEKNRWGNKLKEWDFGKKLLSLGIPGRIILASLAVIADLLFIIVTSIQYGAKTIATSVFNLLKSRPELFMIASNAYEKILDSICDTITEKAANIGNYVLDSVGGGSIMGGFIRSDKNRNDFILEQDKLEGDLKSILDKNLQEIRSFWNHYNIIRRRDPDNLTVDLESTYLIRCDYNHKMTDNRASKDAPIFIGDLNIDNLRIKAKEMSWTQRNIAGGFSPIEFLENKKLSTVPGQLVNFGSQLFTPEYIETFNSLLNLECDGVFSTELTKKQIENKEIMKEVRNYINTLSDSVIDIKQKKRQLKDELESETDPYTKKVLKKKIKTLESFTTSEQIINYKSGVINKQHTAGYFKAIKASDIYPYLAEILTIEERPNKPSYSFSTADALQYNKRAHGALGFLLKIVFRHNIQISVDGGALIEYISIPIFNSDFFVYDNWYENKTKKFNKCVIEVFPNLNLREISKINKLDLYEIALKFTNSLCEKNILNKLSTDIQLLNSEIFSKQFINFLVKNPKFDKSSLGPSAEIIKSYQMQAPNSSRITKTTKVSSEMTDIYAEYLELMFKNNYDLLNKKFWPHNDTVIEYDEGSINIIYEESKKKLVLNNTSLPLVRSYNIQSVLSTNMNRAKRFLGIDILKTKKTGDSEERYLESKSLGDEVLKIGIPENVPKNPARGWFKSPYEIAADKGFKRGLRVRWTHNIDKIYIIDNYKNKNICFRDDKFLLDKGIKIPLTKKSSIFVNLVLEGDASKNEETTIDNILLEDPPIGITKIAKMSKSWNSTKRDDLAEHPFVSFTENEYNIESVLEGIITRPEPKTMFKIKVIIPNQWKSSHSNSFVNDFTYYVSLDQLGYINNTGQSIDNLYKDDKMVNNIISYPTDEQKLIGTFFSKDNRPEFKNEHKFSSDGYKYDLELRGKSQTLKDPKFIKPEIGDIVYINYPERYLSGSDIMYNNTQPGSIMTMGYVTTVKQYYKKDTSLYDILCSSKKMLKIIKDSEDETAGERYYKKQTDERKARMAGISNTEHAWNTRQDEIFEVIKDNWSDMAQKFNIDCVANDVCPRFANNPGYFNITMVLKDSVEIIEIGKGKFPKGHFNLSSKEQKLADLEYFFKVETAEKVKETGKEYINRDHLAWFVSKNIFKKVEYINLDNDELLQKLKFKTSGGFLRGNILDHKDYEIYKINGNYCDKTLPTLYEYLSVCNVWKRPGSKVKEPYPIQMTGYIANEELHKELYEFLEKAGLIAAGTARWVAHRMLDIALLAATIAIIPGGIIGAAVLGSAFALQDTAVSALDKGGNVLKDWGKSFKDSAAQDQESADKAAKKADKAAGKIGFRNPGAIGSYVGEKAEQGFYKTKSMVEEAIGSIAESMGKAMEKMALYIDQGLNFIREKLSNVYNGIHDMVNWIMNSITDLFTSAFKKVAGVNPKEFIMNKIIPQIAKIYEYISGESRIINNPFKAKFTNPGGIMGNTSDFIWNKVGAGKILEQSVLASVQGSVAKSAGLAAKRAITLPIAAINVIPVASVAGGKGASDIAKELGEMAQQKTELFVTKAINWNRYLDGIITQCRIFSNPCHITLMLLGVKLPQAAYTVLKDNLKLILNGYTIAKEKEKELLESSTEIFQEQEEKKIQRIMNKYNDDNCKTAKKLSVLASYKILEEYKKEMLQLKNQKLIIENGASFNADDDEYKKILENYKLLVSKYYLVANYIPYDCAILDSNLLAKLSQKYLVNAELELPKNNKLILTILNITSYIGGITLSYIQKSNSMIIRVEPLDYSKWDIQVGGDPQNKINFPKTKKIEIRIPKTKDNELLFEIAVNNKLSYSSNFNKILDDNYLVNLDDNKKALLEQNCINFYYSTEGQEFIRYILTPSDNNKIKIPNNFVQFFYSLNLFNQSEMLQDYNNSWTRFYQDEKEEEDSKYKITKFLSSGIENMGRLLSSKNLKIQNEAIKKLKFMNENPNDFSNEIFRVSEFIKNLYFDYNTAYLIENYSSYSLLDKENNLDTLEMITQSSDELKNLLQDKSEMIKIKNRIGEKKALLQINKQKIESRGGKKYYEDKIEEIKARIIEIENTGILFTDKDFDYFQEHKIFIKNNDGILIKKDSAVELKKFSLKALNEQIVTMKSVIENIDKLFEGFEQNKKLISNNHNINAWIKLNGLNSQNFIDDINHITELGDRKNYYKSLNKCSFLNDNSKACSFYEECLKKYVNNSHILEWFNQYGLKNVNIQERKVVISKENLKENGKFSSFFSKDTDIDNQFNLSSVLIESKIGKKLETIEGELYEYDQIAKINGESINIVKDSTEKKYNELKKKVSAILNPILADDSSPNIEFTLKQYHPIEYKQNLSSRLASLYTQLQRNYDDAVAEGKEPSELPSRIINFRDFFASQYGNYINTLKKPKEILRARVKLKLAMYNDKVTFLENEIKKQKKLQSIVENQNRNFEAKEKERDDAIKQLGSDLENFDTDSYYHKKLIKTIEKFYNLLKTASKEFYDQKLEIITQINDSLTNLSDSSIIEGTILKIAGVNKNIERYISLRAKLVEYCTADPPIIEGLCNNYIIDKPEESEAVEKGKEVQYILDLSDLKEKADKLIADLKTKIEDINKQTADTQKKVEKSIKIAEEKKKEQNAKTKQKTTAKSVKPPAPETTQKEVAQAETVAETTQEEVAPAETVAKTTGEKLPISNSAAVNAESELQKALKIPLPDDADDWDDASGGGPQKFRFRGGKSETKKQIIKDDLFVFF